MTPQEMGRDWITAAYGSHGPAGRTVQLAHWSKAIPMRSTSALLKSMPNPAQVKPSEFPGDTHGQNLAGVARALVQLLNKWAPSSSPSSSLPALQDGHAGKVQFMLPGQGHQAQSALALPSSEPTQKPIATPARAPSVHLPCTEGQGEAKEAEGTPLQEDEDGDNHGKGHGKTLEDWENETFANLSIRRRQSISRLPRAKQRPCPRPRRRLRQKPWP